MKHLPNRRTLACALVAALAAIACVPPDIVPPGSTTSSSSSSTTNDTTSSSTTGSSTTSDTTNTTVDATTTETSTETTAPTTTAIQTTTEDTQAAPLPAPTVTFEESSGGNQFTVLVLDPPEQTPGLTGFNVFYEDVNGVAIENFVGKDIPAFGLDHAALQPGATEFFAQAVGDGQIASDSAIAGPFIYNTP